MINPRFAVVSRHLILKRVTLIESCVSFCFPGVQWATVIPPTSVFSSVLSLYDHIYVFRFQYSGVTVIIMTSSPLFIALMLAGPSKCLRQIIYWIKLNRVKNSSHQLAGSGNWPNGSVSVQQLTAVPYYLQLLPTYLPTLPALSILILCMDIWGNITVH